MEEITRFRNDGRPVHIYFCEIPTAPLSNDSVQIEAIRNYRDELSRAGLFSSYSTDDQLRIKVRDDLTKRIHNMQERGLIEQPSSTVTVHISDSDQANTAETEVVSRLGMIRGALQGYLASWEARYQSLDDYSVDSRHDLMREVATTIFDAIRQIATLSPESSILPQLQQIAVAANNWSTYRVYLDGGVSFNDLSNGCRQVLDEMQGVIDEDWS